MNIIKNLKAQVEKDSSLLVTMSGDIITKAKAQDIAVKQYMKAVKEKRIDMIETPFAEYFESLKIMPVSELIKNISDTLLKYSTNSYVDTDSVSESKEEKEVKQDESTSENDIGNDTLTTEKQEPVSTDNGTRTTDTGENAKDEKRVKFGTKHDTKPNGNTTSNNRKPNK